MDDVESPGGYEPYRRYPVGGAAVDFVALALAATCWELLAVGSVLDGISLLEGTVILLGIGPVLVAHELTHYFTARSLGLSATIDWAFPTPHAAPLRQHVARGQNLAVLLAPAVVVGGVALTAALTVSHPLVVAACTLAVLVNTACAAGDIVGAVWLAVQPPGTVVYLDVTPDDARELYARPK
ncbi:DUF3267 domain-containing protein [Halomarina rubra]|uniref:DUF3267 domain-containing protein n=1 Tax=Halomarina rubra TaxID=2071873 RepID=A0ABD6ATF4_9EURY|nr:DUF3267 domain-containing protein [Halomarina rubra]